MSARASIRSLPDVSDNRIPLRTVRVVDEIWLPAKERADAEATTVSAVIQHALRRYGEGAVNNVTPPTTAR